MHDNATFISFASLSMYDPFLLAWEKGFYM